MPCLSGGVKRWLTGEPLGIGVGDEEMPVKLCPPLRVTGTVGTAGDHVLVFFYLQSCAKRNYQVSLSPDQEFAVTLV